LEKEMSQLSVSDTADEPFAKLLACEQRIEYAFANKGVLQAALTHASGAEHRLASNERLEFLGDAILGAVVCELLFHRYPEYLEGELTRVKSVVVSRQTCARISHRLGMQEFLILGKGMAGSVRLPESLLADVFESLIAAVYLDGGLAAARAFIEREITDEIEDTVKGRGSDNYKSQLQQLAQR
jgi:ribonuclease-3